MADAITFNDEQLLHYSRQIMLPHFGIEGQQQLHDSHVVIIGIGGLGSPAALYLAASGVGTLTLVDFDTVDDSNLQRQIVHRSNNIGASKVTSAKETLLAINPETTIHCVDKKLSLIELESLISNVTCVIDATDMVSITANLGDVKTTITHPATTTHGRVSDELKARLPGQTARGPPARAGAEVVRRRPRSPSRTNWSRPRCVTAC